jgi:hypothetical protein
MKHPPTVVDSIAKRAQSGSFFITLSLIFFLAGSLNIFDSLTDEFLFKAARLACLIISIALLFVSARHEELWKTLIEVPIPTFLALILIWASLSIFWSIDQTRSMTRLLETLITIAYASTITVLLINKLHSMNDVAGLIFRGVCILAMVSLVGNFIIFGDPLFMHVNPYVPDRPRLQLMQGHPLTSGDILALGLISGIYMRRIRTRELAVFGLLLLRLAFAQRRGTIQILIALAAFAAAIGSVSLIMLNDAGSSIGADSRLLTLTGRLGLWDQIFRSDLVTSAIGVGFDASRLAVEQRIGVLYHPHNEYIATLVEMGYVGLMLHTALIISWATAVILARQGFFAAILLYVALIGIINPGFLTKPHAIFMFILSLSGAVHWINITRPRTGPAHFALNSAQ